MLNIAVCDDDKYICSEIENIIIEYAKETKTAIETEVFYSGEDLYGYMQKDSRIDLVFMDIELGSTTGIAVSQHIRNILDNHSVKIVFITSKDGYEAELFDVQPFNFIKKPVTKQSVSKCLDLLVKLSDKHKEIFEYSVNRTIFKEDFKNIMYFENNLRKVKIVTTNGTNYFNATLAQVKEKLPDCFIEPHGSYLVNYDYIRYMLLGARSTDVGHMLENVVYLELLRRGYDVSVGKIDDLEVDFVAHDGKTTEYYQVAATVREESTLKRELASLQRIKDHYSKILLTLDNDPDADYDGIRRINVLKWLIGEE